MASDAPNHVKDVEPSETKSMAEAKGEDMVTLPRRSSTIRWNIAENKLGLFCFLPPELVGEILLRLSADSLVRVAFSCKTAHGIIFSREFICHHLKRRRAHSEFKILHMCIRLKKIFINLINKYGVSRLHPPFSARLVDGIIGCCYGLVCLSYDSRYLIWNPATRQYRWLPESICMSDGYNIRYLGFGYCSVTKHYKLVLVFRDLHVELFDGSINSWRAIEVIDSAGGETKVQARCVCVNNGLHWIGLELYVLAFDLEREKFRRIMFPEPELKLKSTVLNLAIINESLAMCTLNNTTSQVDIWMINGYGSEEESWTKFVTMPPTQITWLPHVFCFEGGTVLQSGSNIQVYMNDERDEVMKKIKMKIIHNIFNAPSIFKRGQYFVSVTQDLFQYVDTLLPIN